jgi:hypothetical protein
MTIESFLEGHVRAFGWLGGVPRECVYDNLRSAVARRERVDGRDRIHWNQRFSQLRGHYAFHANACTPETPREKGSVENAVRYVKTGFWPARRFGDLGELDEAYAGWRDRVALPRRHATGRHVVADRLAHEREQLRPLPPVAFDAAGRRWSRVPADGYLKFARCFYRAPEALVQQRVELRWDRDRVWIEHHGHRVADYPRSYEHGIWLPAPRMCPEPPPVAQVIPIAGPEIVPPALADYVSPKTRPQIGERLPYLLAKLKTPRILERLEQTAATAREEGWPYEQFLESCSRPRSSPATPPARATASVTPPSRHTRRWRTSTSRPSRLPRSRRSCTSPSSPGPRST